MISVIIPVYNVEEYLHVCLNSVLKQSYGDFEIICIDDASTDSSLEILEYFSYKDSRIKIFKNDYNKGPGYCRNKGLNLACGQYISFLDADDWLSFDAFEILINIAEKSNLDVVIYQSVVYSDKENDFEINSHYGTDFFNHFEKKIFNHFELDKSMIFKLSTDIWNKFYLKSFLDENNIRFSDENFIHENIPFFYKVITAAEKISLINNSLYIHRKNEKSFLFSSEEHLFDDYNILRLVMDVFFENKQLFQYYKKGILNLIFSYNYHKFNSLEKKFKNRYFRDVQNLFKVFIKYYGLGEDILSYVDPLILKKFNFDNIIEILNNPPKLSIIVPVYNTENELPFVLDSIVNQTFNSKDMEVIVIDDCSTDGCRKIIDEYCETFENIIPIYLYENSGSPSKPRNIGIQNANANFIIFQDSDDGFINDACEILYETIIEENVDIVTGMIKRNDGGDTYEITFNPWISILNQYDEFKNKNIEKLLLDEKLFKLKLDSVFDNPLILADYALNSKIFKKSLFIYNNIKFPEDLNGGEDSVVLFNSFIKSKGIVFINRVIYNYNTIRLNSLTHDLSLRTVQNRPKAYRLMYDFVASNEKLKNIFIEILLPRKLPYWFNEYLLKSPFLKYEDILSIFKSQQILFSECVNYNINLPNFLKEICQDIKNNNFDLATNKIIEKRE